MRQLLALILVVALTSVLAQWAARRQAERDLDQCCQNLKSYGLALEIYSMDFAGRYPLRPSALVSNYLTELPRCPTSGRPYTCTTASNPDLYTVVCEGRHHRGWSPKDGYPGCRVPKSCEHLTEVPFQSPTYTSVTVCVSCIAKP